MDSPDQTAENTALTLAGESNVASMIDCEHDKNTMTFSENLPATVHLIHSSSNDFQPSIYGQRLSQSSDRVSYGYSLNVKIFGFL